MIARLKRINWNSERTLTSVAALSTVSLAGGIASGVTVLAVGGSAGLGLSAAPLVQRLRARWAKRQNKPGQPAASQTAAPPPLPRNENAASRSENATVDLAEEMLRQGRYSLLLRSRIAEHLSTDQWQRAKDALDDQMALVPQGEVIVKELAHVLTADGDAGQTPADLATPYAVNVDHFFLDRYPVTNRQYQHFVAAGGYGQLPLWDQQILPALLDFVDTTGQPGPRFWKDGHFPVGQDDLPVVGVSWHEALAYSRWAGKRLPSDPEWVKAGSWPITLSRGGHSQRRFPWGDNLDLRRANLWASGIGSAVDVTAYADGVSVGGVYGLIGNVWEWTTGDYDNEEWEDLPRMKNIRGGAFDTYFENQASCDFVSGENLLGRKHNIGFRCALGACDLALQQPVETPANGLEQLAEMAV